MENPSGNYDNEATRIKEKADNMAKHVTSSALSEEAAGTLYSSMYINSICYGFASGCMSLSQAEKAQSAFTTAILQPLGFNRNTPRKVAYAESNKGGAGLRHLFSEQGTRQAKALLYHIRKQTKLGDTLRINLKWAQRVCGTSKPILSEPSRRLPHIGEERWMITLRQFLHLSELGIHIDTISETQPKRTHDRHIMDIVTTNHSYTNRAVKAINSCRVYLRAETISDITDAAGTTITTAASTCRRSNTGSRSLWPRQPRPTNIAPWKVFLKSLCTTKTCTLDQPLGTWTSNPHEREWDTYYNHKLKMVITFMNNQWQYTFDIVKMQTRWEVKEFSHYHSQTLRHRQELIPVRLYNTYGILHISVPLEQPTKLIQPPQSWTQYVTSLEPWEHGLIKNTMISNHLALRKALTSMNPEPLFIVSDGSYKEGKGAFSWILADSDKTLAENTDTVAGNPITPLRTECAAILSWLLFLTRYSEFRNMNIRATIQPFTDCTLTLKYVTTLPIPPKENSPLRPDYDITNEIHHRFSILHSRCNFLLSGQYVKGHQKKPFPTRQSMLNHTCDSNAKAARHNQTTPPNLKLPKCYAYLISDNDHATGDEINTCRWKWRNKILFQYFEKKFNLHPHTIQAIHWDAYAKAKSPLPPALKRFVTKLTIRWLPSANRLKMFGNEIDTCHLCPLEETNHHIYQCSHRIPDFHSRHSALQTFLTSIHTPTTVSTAIATGILNWASKASAATNEAFIITLPDPLAKCFQRQSILGWDLATFGLMDSHWCRLIPRATDKTMRTQWQAKVTKWLFESAHEIWKKRNSERNTIDPETKLNAQRRETEAKLIKVYELAAEHLSPYDHHELIKETLEERQSIPEPTNRIWVDQIQRLIYQRIRQNRTRPLLTDIRTFFPPTKLPNKQAAQRSLSR